MSTARIIYCWLLVGSELLACLFWSLLVVRATLVLLCSSHKVQTTVGLKTRAKITRVRCQFQTWAVFDTHRVRNRGGACIYVCVCVCVMAHYLFVEWWNGDQSCLKMYKFER